MKKVLFLTIAACLLAVSCGPSKHAVHVEMRHPSKSGIDLAGKIVSVVYFENDDVVATDFCEAMAKDFRLRSDYSCGSSGIFRLFHGAKRVLPMQQLQIPCGMFD